MKLALGIVIFLIIILVAFYYVAVRHKNEVKEKMIGIIISVILGLVDLFGLIIPGTKPIECFNNYKSEKIEDNDNLQNNVIDDGRDNQQNNINGNDNQQNIDNDDHSQQSSINGNGNRVTNINIENVTVIAPEGGGININEEDILQNYTTDSEDNGLDQVKTLVRGWGDDLGGRKQYTINEVNGDNYEDGIVFNSISNGTIGEEIAFVGARENTGINDGQKNKWMFDIKAEKEKSYLIRLYAHNNSKLGNGAIARNVRIRINIFDPVRVTTDDMKLKGFDSSGGYYAVRVTGYIMCSNSYPKKYWHSIKFVSDKPFHLKYIPGSAIFENNGIGKDGGCRLSDDIVSEEGVLIGYDKLDGNIPGCFEYASYSAITVYPVFD